MTSENCLKAQIALYAHAEAADLGGYNAMLAVACILRNRVKAGWGGGSWAAVLSYASESAAEMPYPPMPVDIGDPNFRRVLQEIDDIYMGLFADEMTSGGLYYMNALHPHHALRPWFREKILSQPHEHPRVAQVGMLFIYR